MLREVMDILDILDDAHACGAGAERLLRSRGADDVTVRTVRGDSGRKTDFIKAVIHGTQGRLAGGDAPTLGIVGRLGGIGARPEAVGFVSDGDGAAAALAAALKLTEMARRGDRLRGDVIVATQICPEAPTLPHEPVPFMNSPVEMRVMNEMEVDPRMEAVLSVDTTKGNRLVNRRGIAVTPTVKDGYILPPSDDLLDLLQIVTGELPSVLPVTMQDLTPYGNGLYHLNSIMQPCVVTSAPVVGVAVVAQTVVPGCATGASHETDIELAARFAVETAKAYGAGKCNFYDPEQWALLTRLYGTMERLRQDHA